MATARNGAIFIIHGSIRRSDDKRSSNDRCSLMDFACSEVYFFVRTWNWNIRARAASEDNL